MAEGFGRDTWTLEPEAITKVVKVSPSHHKSPSAGLFL